jgi:hypothetical protein
MVQCRGQGVHFTGRILVVHVMVVAPPSPCCCHCCCCRCYRCYRCCCPVATEAWPPEVGSSEEGLYWVRGGVVQLLRSLRRCST